LPPDIVIQIPPNLVPDPLFLLDCLAAGAQDLGYLALSMKLIPITSIYTPDKLKEFLAVYGWELKQLLP
jgi:FO synthase subunit 1